MIYNNYQKDTDTICTNCQKETKTIYKACEECRNIGWCRGCGLTRIPNNDMFCDLCVPQKIQVATC